MSMYLCQPKYDITHVVAHIECEFCCTSMKEGHKCLFNLEITVVCCTTDDSGTHGTKKQFQWHSCPDQRFSGLPGIMESFNGTHGIFSYIYQTDHRPAGFQAAWPLDHHRRKQQPHM